MENSLTSQIRYALANNLLSELIDLKEICDKLHRAEYVENYTPEDMPTDELYEEMKNKVELARGSIVTGVLTSRDVDPSKTYGTKNLKELSDLHMAKDAIRKDSYVSIIDQRVICMPKYDGCSVCARFISKDNQMILDQSETRGDDVAFSLHKSTDMNDLLQIVLDSKNCKWFHTEFQKLAGLIKSITIRGEMVLVDKSINKPPASYVAGQINRKNLEFDPDHVIGYKMFEITRIIEKSGESVVPDQLKACKILQAIDPSLTYEILDLNSNSEENTNKVLDLFKLWKNDLESPIDGVVYCKPDWRYPLYKNEERGVNYGKYALKPSDKRISKIKFIEYNIGKDGKLVPVIHYNLINYSGKEFRKAKSCISDLYKFINENNLNTESIIDVTFQKGMIPNITRVESPINGDPIKLPEVCPECKSRLILKVNKSIVTLTCTNIACPGILIKKLNHFCKNMQIKGISDKTLKSFMEKSGNDIKTVFDLINEKIDKDIKNIIEESTISNLLVSLDLYTKTQISKDPNLSSIQGYLVQDYIILIRDNILSKFNSPIVDAVRLYLE